MTKQELSQLYYLNKEVKLLKDRITELETASTGASARITGMPKGEFLYNKVIEYVIDIEELKEMLETQLKKCLNELKILNKYIASIDDSQIRMIMTLRYVQGLTWRQVAFRLGGKNTEDGVKKRINRYIIKN